MLRSWFFIWSFGTLFLLSLFLVPFWIRYAHKRRVDIIKSGILFDRYYLLSFSIACSSLGIMLIYAGRLYGNLAEGLSPMLLRNESWVIGFGSLTLQLGLRVMVMLADLEQHPAKWTWSKIGIGLTLLWAVVSYSVAQHVPLPIDGYFDNRS